MSEGDAPKDILMGVLVGHRVLFCKACGPRRAMRGRRLQVFVEKAAFVWPSSGRCNRFDGRDSEMGIPQATEIQVQEKGREERSG